MQVCNKRFIGGILLNNKNSGIIYPLIFGILTILIVLILLSIAFFDEEILEFFKDALSEDY